MPFNIGPGELILVLLIALLVIGPGKLPDVGQALGRSIREFRKAVTDEAPPAVTQAPVAPPSGPTSVHAEADPDAISR